MLSLAEAQVELVQHMITLKFGKEQIYLKSTIDPRHSPWGGRGEGRPMLRSERPRDGSPGPSCLLPGTPSRAAPACTRPREPVARTWSRSGQETGRPVSEIGSFCSKKPNERAAAMLGIQADGKPLINFVAFFCWLVKRKKKKKSKRRRRKGIAVHYSFASASLLFISALCSLSAGGVALAPSALFFLEARPDATCLSLAFLGALWLAEVFFGLELGALGFSTCTERQADRQTQTETQRGGRGREN